MARRTIAIVLVIIIVGAVAGYFFYMNYVQGTVTLKIVDPPPIESGYGSSVQHVYITFTRIEIHSANARNDSGWHTIFTSQTIDLVAAVNVSQTVGNAKLPTGKYDQLRFFATNANVTTLGVSMTINIPSGSQTGIKVVINGGGFQMTPTSSVSVQLTLQFDSASATFTTIKADVV